MAEAALPGWEATQWFELFTSGGTPRAIIERLSQETKRAVRAPDLKEKMSADGLAPVGNKPEEFASYVKSEMAKWARVVKAADINSRKL